MKKSLVSYDIDLTNPPRLTEAQEVELAALAGRPDGELDVSEISVMPETFWDNAVRGRFYRPTKTSTTVRIDSDVLVWLRGQGRGYQTRLNAILRREMLSTLKLADGDRVGGRGTAGRDPFSKRDRPTTY